MSLGVLFLVRLLELRSKKGKPASWQASPATGSPQRNSFFRKNFSAGILNLKKILVTRMSSHEVWLAITRYQPSFFSSGSCGGVHCQSLKVRMIV